MQLAEQQPHRQQGVALITALLIVALATIISVSISKQLQLDVRRTGNMLASEQAMLYTLAAEDWSRRILKDDRVKNNIDHLEEDWAIKLPTLPVEGGTIEGQLHDLQGCFNLNSLYHSDAVDSIAKTRFQLLLQNLKFDAGTPTLSIIDWIDDDQNTSIPDGAEDTYYMNLEKPYRTANAPIQSISELRTIRGFENSDIYDALIRNNLENLVCAFGTSTLININVNTAPAEVLESLGTSINADSIIKEREKDPFDSINDFIDRNALKTVISKANRAGLSVSTDYFLLETVSIIGQARTIMYSVIFRDPKGVTTIISRSQGAY